MTDLYQTNPNIREFKTVKNATDDGGNDIKARQEIGSGQDGCLQVD
jgi:hypothetical protein